MTFKRVLVLILLPLSLIFFISCLSCGSDSADSKPETQTPPKAVKKTEKTFTYTETPTLAMIPKGDVIGEANGKAFKVGTIILEPAFDHWAIKLIEKKNDDIEVVAEKGIVFDVELTEVPARGKVLKRAMEMDGGVLTYYDPDGRTANWSGENAWIIKFTRWNVKPYNATAGNGFQLAGKASGRIAICFKGDATGEIKDSWAAGEFSDAPVVYRGKPGWVK